VDVVGRFYRELCSVGYVWSEGSELIWVEGGCRRLGAGEKGTGGEGKAWRGWER